MAVQSRHGAAADIASGLLMEQLEPRMLLDGVPSPAPFPALSDLESVENTVVRMQTSFGTIDVELFDRAGPGGEPDLAAPLTSANFLNYVKSGRYDEVIFHRLAPGFVLQGGGFRVLDDSVVQETERDAPLINEFDPGRSNVERTLAMAKLGGNPDSATNQFFFNLADNSENLDVQNGGFTVFARVIDDSSWRVVEEIATRPVQDFSEALHPAFTDVPLGTLFDGFDSVFVRMLDLEVIKPVGVPDFFAHRVFFPEGFTSETVTEFVPIGNPNDEAVRVQVIARAELPAERAPGDGHWPLGINNWHRDFVIAEQTIEARTRGGITISRAASPAFDLLPRGVPYSLEVQSTLPVTAMLSHYDFGTATGEAFTTQASDRWAFGEAERDTETAGLNEFLVWQNTEARKTTVTITFYFDEASGREPLAIERVTEPMRRDGLALSQMSGLPSAPMSIIVESADAPIVAALTRFDSRGEEPLGSTALGVPGEPSKFGAVPSGMIGENSSFKVTFVNPGEEFALITVVLSFEDPDIGDIVRTLTVENSPGFPVEAKRRATLDVAGIDGVPQDTRFSLRYQTAGLNRIYAHATQFDLNDVVENPLAIYASKVHHFAEGFMDHNRAGDDIFETISVFNPVISEWTGGITVAAEVELTFYYTDGSTVIEQRTVESGRRIDVHLHELPGILQQSQDGLRFFSIEVTSNLPIVAQMTHFDFSLGGDGLPSGGFSTLSTMGDVIVRLDKLDNEDLFG